MASKWSQLTTLHYTFIAYSLSSLVNNPCSLTRHESNSWFSVGCVWRKCSESGCFLDAVSSSITSERLETLWSPEDDFLLVDRYLILWNFIRSLMSHRALWPKNNQSSQLPWLVIFWLTADSWLVIFWLTHVLSKMRNEQRGSKATCHEWYFVVSLCWFSFFLLFFFSLIFDGISAFFFFLFVWNSNSILLT